MTTTSPPPAETPPPAHGEGTAQQDLDGRATPADSAEPVYGFPAPLWRTLEHRPPPGLRRITRWRSPLRGPWLTSVFGAVLLVTLPIVTITGLLSYVAYAPQLNQAIPADVGWLHLPVFA